MVVLYGIFLHIDMVIGSHLPCDGSDDVTSLDEITSCCSKNCCIPWAGVGARTAAVSIVSSMLTIVVVTNGCIANCVRFASVQSRLLSIVWYFDECDRCVVTHVSLTACNAYTIQPMIWQQWRWCLTAHRESSVSKGNHVSQGVNDNTDR